MATSCFWNQASKAKEAWFPGLMSKIFQTPKSYNNMAKHSAIFLLGIFVGLLPSLGFPPRWDAWLMVGSGTALAVLAIFVRRDAPKQTTASMGSQPFVDIEKQNAPDESTGSFTPSGADGATNMSYATAEIPTGEYPVQEENG